MIGFSGAPEQARALGAIPTRGMNDNPHTTTRILAIDFVANPEPRRIRKAFI